MQPEAGGENRASRRFHYSGDPPVAAAIGVMTTVTASKARVTKHSVFLKNLDQLAIGDRAVFQARLFYQLLSGVRRSHTTATADHLGVKVQLTNRWRDAHAGLACVLHRTANASTSVARTRRHRWLVLINESLNANARFAILAHELGHIYCGHLGAHAEGFWPDRSGTLTKQQREIEAEAVAYLVCKRLELKTRSALYLRRHVTPENLSAISKRLIVEATNRIEARS